MMIQVFAKLILPGVGPTWKPNFGKWNDIKNEKLNLYSSAHEINFMQVVLH